MERQENLGNKRPGKDMDQIIGRITDININSDLPIGVSSISEMLSTPYYVDKTEYAYRLLAEFLNMFFYPVRVDLVSPCLLVP